ncbi:hypothetical protein EV581_111103 [Bacillus sp. BK006]|nr:hypothetical protein EV581_111103 [Bacillus sp. BK006]
MDNLYIISTGIIVVLILLSYAISRKNSTF